MLYMNLILLTGTITAGWALLHSNSIVLKQMPDVEAYCPQALICSAANISFLLSCSVSSTIFPLASSDAKLAPWHSWGHVVVLIVPVKLQLHLLTFFSPIWVYSVLCHIHRNLPWADRKNHSLLLGCHNKSTNCWMDCEFNRMGAH